MMFIEMECGPTLRFSDSQYGFLVFGCVPAWRNGCDFGLRVNLDLDRKW